MHRRDDEDPPLAAQAQLGPRVPREQERARQQDRQQIVPAILVELLDRRDVLKPGVGDHGVEPTEPVDRLRDGSTVPFPRRQIGDERLPRAFRVGLAVDREHAPAVGHEPVGDGAADAARSSGDERSSRRHGPPRT